MEDSEVKRGKKLRALHVITKLELGGAQKSTLYTVKKLDRNKFDIFLVSSNQGLLVEEAQNIADCKTILLHSLRRKTNPLFDLKALLDLIRIIKKEKIDIVHTHSSKAGVLGRLAARLAGVKIVFHTIHGFSFNHTQNPVIKKIFKFLERKTASISDGLITVCESDIKLGRNNGIGKEDRYCLVRENRAALDSFSNQDSPNPLPPVNNEGDNIVGTVACFKPQKSPLDFIRACRIISQKVPNTKFIMIGDGILRRKAERLSRRLGLDKKLFFLSPQDPIADHYEFCIGYLIRVVHHPKNRGYGGALRSGFKNAKYDYIFYTDGDCQFDLKEMHKLLPLIKDADIVAGFRMERKDPLYRRVNAHAYNILVRILFGLTVRDIDCAFKLLSKEAIDSLGLESDSQFISAEFLIKAKKKGLRIKQIGVGHYPRITGRPTGNWPGVVMKSFLELFKLWKTLK